MTRFMRNVLKDPDTGCWNWVGALYKNGYGLFTVYDPARRRLNKNRGVLAHRWFFQQKMGVIPSKKILCCHHCDNKKCVNIKHIFLGTHKDNMIDQSLKGKNYRHLFPESGPIGELHGSSKMTEKSVRKARSIYSKGGIGYKNLGKKFGISTGSMRDIIKKKNWRFVK